MWVEEIFTTTAEGGNHHRFVWVEEILCVGGGDIHDNS